MNTPGQQWQETQDDRLCRDLKARAKAASNAHLQPAVRTKRLPAQELNQEHGLGSSSSADSEPATPRPRVEDVTSERTEDGNDDKENTTL